MTGVTDGLISVARRCESKVGAGSSSEPASVRELDRFQRWIADCCWARQEEVCWNTRARSALELELEH
ncbi:hypothetical protein J6590_046781 [Homalodisca vitripennis]|nr:hypothetical protein J6590_046781 [Homalodisca vitripennis]